MLRLIEIANIALIDRASIDFRPGLCVLTGETGAGKSIIIDSINAVLGARATRDIVRKGSEGATVTAVFDTGGDEPGGRMLMQSGDNARLRTILRENGIGQDYASGLEESGDALQEDNPAFHGSDAGGGMELILSREINASGRNVCRVNGRIVAAPVLRAIGELIVDLHGQHENHSLMKREKHIEMIDNFGGARLLEKRARYSALYTDYWHTKKRIDELVKGESERARAIDILRFQIDEIKTVRPQLKEDERLLAQIETLANAEKIVNALNAAGTMLYGGGGGRGESAAPGEPAAALENISGAIKALSQITQYSNDYAELSEKLSEARYLADEVAVSLRTRLGADDLDPGRLDRLSGRHEAIERLKRKYGGSIKEIHFFYKNAVEKLNILTNSERTAGELEQKLQSAASEMNGLAFELTEMRKEAAVTIEEGVVRELDELEMKNCRFNVAFNTSDSIDSYNSKGRDQLEFLFCANPGEELKPLVRIASGGEMSRVMLAIKSVLIGADSMPTMIFDEIDNGISGNAASRVAEKMHLLSRGRQIICVTHLAQIASMADDQFLIEKTSTEDETQTNIRKLEDSGRVNEISRMLGGGAPTEASLRLSRELLDRAGNWKLEAGN